MVPAVVIVVLLVVVVVLGVAVVLEEAELGRSLETARWPKARRGSR
jgi:hypothetical protein